MDITLYYSNRVSTPQQSEIEELQAQLASEQKQVLKLKQRIASGDEHIAQNKEERSVLQRDLERLRRRNDKFQTELAEARQQLAEMKASMKKATKTVTSLKQVLSALFQPNGHCYRCIVVVLYCTGFLLGGQGPPPPQDLLAFLPYHF